MNDLFEYLEIHASTEKKAATGESTETLSTADDIERF